jgi:hypothetical protein
MRGPIKKDIYALLMCNFYNAEWYIFFLLLRGLIKVELIVFQLLKEILKTDGGNWEVCDNR